MRRTSTSAALSLAILLSAGLSSCGGGGDGVDLGTNAEEVGRMYDLLDTLNPEEAFASLSGFSATSLYPGDPGIRDTLDVGLNGGVPDYIYFRHVDEEALLVKSPEELSSYGSYVYSDTFSDRESEFISFEYGLERINIHSDYADIAQAIADPVSAGLILPMVPEELYPYVGIEFSQDGGFTFAIGYDGDGDLPIPAMHSEVQIGGDGLLSRLEGEVDGSSYSVDFDYDPSFERKTDLGFGPSIDDDDVFDILGFYPEDPDNFFFEYGALRLDIEGDDDSLPAFLKGLRSATVYLETPGWAPVYLCLEGNAGETHTYYQAPNDHAITHLFPNGEKESIPVDMEGDFLVDERADDIFMFGSLASQWVYPAYYNAPYDSFLYRNPLYDWPLSFSYLDDCRYGAGFSGIEVIQYSEIVNNSNIASRLMGEGEFFDEEPHGYTREGSIDPENGFFKSERIDFYGINTSIDKVDDLGAEIAYSFVDPSSLPYIN